ncbi:MAG: hypothetical protein LLF95_11450 [Bacteroidales bacterium]|nr:hypothetical protein [Bacteroidales bacterium]
MDTPIKVLKDKLNAMKNSQNHPSLQHHRKSFEVAIPQYELAISILEAAEASRVYEDSNCNKPLVSGSFCPECNSENIRPYNDTPMECLECHHVWL